MIIPEDDKKCCTIKLRAYKTAKKYSDIDKELTIERSKLVRDYVKKHKLTTLLFPVHSNNEKLSGFIETMLRKVGQKGSINLIRKIIVSSHEGILNKTIEQRIEFGRHMMHNYETTQHYMKGLTPEEKEKEKEKEEKEEKEGEIDKDKEK